MDIVMMDSVIPEKENLVYHVVAMKWYLRWLKYTGVADASVTASGDDENP